MAVTKEIGTKKRWLKLYLPDSGFHIIKLQDRTISTGK